MVEQVVAYRPIYSAIAGDITCGLLLSQIVYWFGGPAGKSKLRVQREGKLWLAKTREALQTECGLSAAQYKRAYARLKELQLIETHVWHFGGVPTTHIWLDQAKLLELMADIESTVAEAPAKSKWSKQPKPYGENHHNHMVNSATSYTETTAETTAESKAAPGATSKSEKSMTKAVDVLSGFKNRPKNPGSSPYGIPALEVLWKRLLTDELGGWQSGLTGKDRGQLKHLLDKLGDQRPAAPAVLTYAIQNWPTFVYEAKLAVGLSLGPEKPQLGFVLQHLPTLMQLIATAKTQKPGAPAAGKPEHRQTSSSATKLGEKTDTSALAARADSPVSISDFDKLQQEIEGK